MPARKAAPKIQRLVPVNTSEVLAAADIVSKLLKATATHSLDALHAAVEAGDESAIAKVRQYELTDEQVALIERWDAHMRLLRNSPTAFLTECPDCGAISVATGTKPGRCQLTLACTGVPVKSVDAKAVPAA